jgi:hypothetical protein
MGLVADATDVVAASDTARRTGRRRPLGRRAATIALVALAASPVVLGALALVGETWFPIGDWASLVYRTSQVGTRDTPLVGAYTVKAWAHPGPLLFWLGAPLYRLTGGDPRAVEWTAAAINVAAVAGIAAVAWRRGRWPLLLGLTALASVVVHGIGAEFLADMWNPFVPLLPFLLAIVLVWDAGLGRHRALVEAAVPATFAMQCHLAFVPLTGLLVVWLVAWSRWSPRLVPTPSPPEPSAVPDGDDSAGRSWASWRPTARSALVVAGVLWLAPALDAVFDMHNPGRIANSFGSDTDRLGPLDAVGLVGRYLRPDGPWMGGAEPTKWFEAQGSGPLPVLLALAVLAGCLHLARRRRLVDVAALASLSLLLVIGSIPAASQFIRPVELYLTQWLKLVGGLVWFTAAWTAWRLVEPAVRAVPVRRMAAAAVAAAVVLAGAASTWGEATSLDAPMADEGAIVDTLGDRLVGELPRDEVIRVERRGEPWHIFAPGLIYSLIDRGYDVTTSDGSAGLKWGHAHRWVRGEHYDRLLTVAVHDPGNYSDAFAECQRRGATLLAQYDALHPDDRAWLEDLRLRRVDDPDSISDDETRRAADLEADDLRIGVFESRRICAADQVLDPDD